MGKYKVCRCICVWCIIKWPFKKFWAWTMKGYDR